MSRRQYWAALVIGCVVIGFAISDFATAAVCGALWGLGMSAHRKHS